MTAKRKKAKLAPARELAPKRQRFVVEYLIDRNATQAAIRSGYSAHTAASQGQRLLKDALVKAAIDTETAEQSKRTKISADRVLEEYWSIATANANELVEYRRCCCRCCYGKGHRRQRTAQELANARAMFALRTNPQPTEVFDEEGGDGFDARREPHAKCTECFGEGVGSVFFKDSRKLSPDALRLYGGVKVVKGGIEVLAHDKVAALDRLARHFGLLRDKPDDEDEEDTEEDIEARLVALLQRAMERKRSQEPAA